MKGSKLINDFLYYLFFPILNKKNLANIKKIKKYIIWNIYKREFKKVGMNSKIAYPFNIKGYEFIEIGDNFQASEGCTLEVWNKYRNYPNKYIPQLVIGNNITINDFCHISCMKKVVIKDGVLIGRNVFITDNFHGSLNSIDIDLIPLERNIYSKGSVIIEENVWVGKNVCIMPGVVIGKNSIIGANAVVTNNIPRNSVAVGVPAKVIRKI